MSQQRPLHLLLPVVASVERSARDIDRRPLSYDRLVGASNATLAGKRVVARVYSHGTQFVVVVLRPDCSVVAIEHVS